MNSPIDWQLASATAARLQRPTPTTAAHAEQTVNDLRRTAERARRHVERFTGTLMPVPAPTLIVDRNGIIDAHVQIFQTLIARAMPGKDWGSATRWSGLGTGALIAPIASRVLGMYDGYTPPPGSPGRLLLAAPNIVASERALGLAENDFRLWICLHEETHRAQHIAAPWLNGHLIGLLGQAVSTRAADEKRQVTSRIAAAMSVIEGHANVVMDIVGRDEIKHFDSMKARSRRGSGTVRAACANHVFKWLMRAKMRQYTDGRGFVSHVIDQIGSDGFNTVWSSADTLPSLAEITDPDAWIRRVG